MPKQIRQTPREVREIIDAYFDQCDEEGKRGTRPGLILALGISEDTFIRYEGGEGPYANYCEPVKKALLRIRDDLEQRNDAKSMFLLKQKCYGGYTDRPTDDAGGVGLKINVTFGGKGGNVEVNSTK